MISRNKSILCFCLVMFITLMCCCVVSAHDNVDYNTTTTHNTENTIQKTITETNTNNIQTKTLAQSEDNTIEETDDQNEVEQDKINAKAEINKVSNTKPKLQASPTIVTAASQITGNRSGEYVLGADIDLGTARINITGPFTLDGQGHTISRNGAGAAITTKGKVDSITFKNVIINNKGSSGATFNFVECTNVIFDNCTFINCSKADGVINARYGCDIVITDSHFIGTYPIIYITNKHMNGTEKDSTLSLCQVYYNGTEITTDDFNSNSTYLVYTSTRASSVFLYINMDEFTLGESSNFVIKLGKQISGLNDWKFTDLVEEVSYKLYDSNNNVLKTGSGSTGNGGYSFSYLFNKKGKYYLDYDFAGTSDYRAVGGTKTILITESSSMSDLLITSISPEDGIDVQVSLNNSTGSNIVNAPVIVTINGHDYTGTTDSTGVATINLPYTLYGHNYEDVVVTYPGDEDNFIAPSVSHQDLDLTKPLIKDTSIVPVTPVQGIAGSSVTLSATVKDQDDELVTEGSVTFSVDGVALTPVSFNNGVATCQYTINNSDSVSVNVSYSGNDNYKPSNAVITVNRITIPTNLTIIDIPNELRVNKEFNFNVKLTNRTGEAISGKPVKVYVNDVEVENLRSTDENGLVSVSYTPTSNNQLNIYAVYTTDYVYLSNTTSVLTIPSSSISLIGTTINDEHTGNASIGHDYVVKVNLTTEDNELLDASAIDVLLDSNLQPSEHHEYDSETKILTITFKPTEVTVYHFELEYRGLNGVYAPCHDYFNVSVDKIKTSTHVDLKEYDSENITLMVEFRDADGNLISRDAIFHVNVNNSEEERQDIDMNNLDDPSYRYNVTMEDGVFYVQIDPKFYRDNNITYCFITFNGTDKYDRSTGSIGEMEVKTDIIINLGTFADKEHTTRKSVFYVNETVNIYLDLINHLGFKQNGGINISIANNQFPEKALNITGVTSSNVYGYYYNFTTNTSGEYTITVNYKGSGAYNPGSITKTFTLMKLSSSTTARVINNTAGNITLGVKVDDNLGRTITKGNLTVEVNGIPRVIPFDVHDGEEVIVNLNSIGLGISTTSEVPITITYQGNEKYSSSVAIDEESISEGNPRSLTSITADKGITNITATVEPENVTVDGSFDVYGYIKELDGTPVSTGNINITIINPDGSIKTSTNVSTNGNGYFTQSYTATLADYPAGEYLVNISYYDDDHNLTTVQKTLNISKVSTKINATIVNSTAGNITVRVKVTDTRGNPVTEGKVNITNSNGEVLYEELPVNEYGEAILVVDSITDKGEYDFIVNYDGTDKYSSNSTSDGLSDVSVTMRDLTINTTIVNSTYNNISFKVNITDTTTKQGLSGKVFQVLDAGNNVLTTGTTGPDGTIIIDGIDLPVGSQTVYINYTDSVSYTSKRVPVTIDVEGRESNINATLVNSTAGNVTVRVNATDKTTGEPITSGTIIITDNDEVVAEYTYDDATGLVDVPTSILDSGKHNLIVTLHSNNYKDSTYTDSTLSNINVDKRNTTVSFTPINSTIGNTTVQVTVTDTNGTAIINGTVNVYSDEERTNLIGTALTDENGIATVNVTTTKDTNTIYVEYPGNITYAGNITKQSLTLTKRETNVNASLVNSTAGDVTVRVNATDASTGEPLSEGTIVVKDKDGNIVAEVPITSNPGYIDVVTNITESGSNKLTVEYIGTDVYSDATFDDEDDTLSFTVEKRNATVSYEVVNSTYNDTVVKVTILDQDGTTPIVDGVVNVYINGVETPVGTNTTDADGVAVIYLKDVPEDTTSLVINYNGNTTYNENITTQDITITPRSVSVNASITNTSAGNVTVRVNVTDIATGNAVNSGIINITNNGEVVATVDLASAVIEDDGTVLVYTNVSETGRYKLTVEYDGTPLYDEEFYNIAAFNVLPKESNITATVPNTTKGNTTVNVTFVDPVTGEGLNGTVYVSVNGSKPVPVEVIEGNGEIPVDLPVGESTITVTFDGDEKYNETKYEFPVTVEPRSIDVGYTITNHTQGNVTIEVTVNDTETGEGINGTVIVDVDGTPVEVEIIDGVGTAVLDIPITGGEITVSYPADDTYEEVPATNPETVTVTQRNSSVTAVSGNTVAGNTSVIVTLTDPVTGEPITSGTIVVTDNGVEVARVEFNEETGVVEVPTNITTSGDHKLNVTFVGNENYTSSSYTDDALSNINIANRTAKIDVTVLNDTVGNTTIEVSLTDSETGDSLPEGGVVEVYDGDKLVGTGTIDSTGKTNITFSVPVDTSSVTVKYLGNDTSYNPLEETLPLDLAQREASVTAQVTNTTAGNITVKVNVTDATTGEPLTSGIVDITLNGKVVGTVDLSTATVLDDGTVEIFTDIENTGNYVLVAKYSGDENHTGQTVNIEAFDSTPKESQITAEITNTTKGNTTLDVSFVDPVTGEGLNGTVYVSTNGEEPGKAVKIVNGVPEEEVLLDLPVGENTVKVTFDGDKKYNSTSYEFDVTVEPRETNLTAAITNNTQGNITLEVNMTDATTGEGINGTVEVTLPNGTVVPVEVVDGKGVTVLDIPITDSDKPITVTFPSDGVNNETSYTIDSVPITKRNSTVEAEVTSTVANKTEVTVRVTDPVTGEPITSGEVTVKLGDEEIGKLPVGSDGTVVVPVDLPNKGNYDLVVSYDGNENYTSDSVELSDVTIEGSQSQFTTEVVNATQGNVTVKVNLTDPVTGEELPLDKVNVKLPDGTVEEFPVEDGQIVVPLDVGNNDITISYPGDDTYNATEIPLTVNVEPRDATIKAEVTNTTAGNITVKVNVTDATTGEPLTSGVVNVTVGGEVVGTIDLSTATVLDDGTVEVVTNITKTGKYTLTVEYGDNENYTNSYINLEAFDSKPKESNITATVPNTTKGNTTVNVTFVDPVTGEGLNGTVYVSVNGSKPVPVEVIEGNGEIPVDLPVGESTITVTFDGDEKYNETKYEFPVTVEPRSIDVGYTITNHTQGNVTIEVTVNDTETGEGINGTVIVDVDGTPVEVEIIDGVGTAVLDIPITGGEITVSYPADDTYEEVPATNPETVTVTQRNSSVTAVSGNTVAGNTSVIVTLTDPVTGEPITSGTIVVTDNGVEVARVEFNEETGVVEVPTNITTSGDHKLNVTFVGNENYTSSSYTDDALSNINIANRTAKIDVTVLNDTVGNTTIEVSLTDSETGDSLPEGGVVEVYDGDKLVGTGTIDSTGKTNITFSVPVDTSSVTVKYLGNDTSYNPLEETLPLDLAQREASVTAQVTNTTAGNITVKVNVTDATTGEPLTSGIVDITLNGKVVGTVDLSTATVLDDGTVEIFTDIENTGNYVLVAKYSGDENHTGQTVNIEAFDSTPKESQITAEITNTTKGNTTLDVSFVDPVTGEGLNGTVYVSTNGEEPGKAVKIVNGVPEEEVLLDLPVGENTVKVTFDGDKKYNSTSYEFDVTVEPRETNLTAAITNNTQGNITLEVNMTDATTGEGINGTVEVTLPNGTVVPVEVVDGKGVTVLDIPITDSDKPITVTFPSDGVNNETSYTIDSVPITKRNSTVEAEVTSTVANKTEVTVRVTDPVTGEPITSGEVTVKLGDEEIGKLPVGSDGTVVVPVDLPNKGNYDLVVSYDGNENYTSDSVELSDVTIEGSQSQFTTEVVNATQGNVTVKVNLTDPVTGEELPLDKVNVKLPDGTVEEFPVEDGQIVVPLETGENNITISYPGDDTYNATETTIPINVEPRQTSMDVEVTNTTAGNVTVKVNVTDATTGLPVTSGNVTLTVNGKEVGRAEVQPDGTVTLTADIGSTGSYNIVTKFEGNENFTEVTKNTGSVNILPKESQLTAELTNNTQGNITLDIKLVDPVTGEGLNGTVTITLPNGTNVPVQVTDGELKLPLDLPVGNSNIKVTYQGNETYDSIHYELPVSVEKRQTSITTEIDNTTAGSVEVKATVTDSSTNKPVTTGNVVVMVGDEIVGRAPLDNNGEAVIPANITKEGSYDMVIKYEGSTNYEDSNVTEDNIKVDARESNVTVEVSNSTVGDTTINVTLVDPATNKPIAGEVIITLPDGSNITVTAENGNVVVPVDLPVGDNTITVTYPGDDTYDDVVVEYGVKVNKRATKTSATELSGSAGSVAVEVKVSDEETENPITSGVVKILSNGTVVGEAPVNNKGVAVVNTSIATAGDYKLDIIYEGSTDYESSQTSLEETVTPRSIKTDVKIENNTVEDTKVVVTVTDEETGKPVPNEIVSVTLPNGTTINVTTDDNGQAVVSAQLPSGNNQITVDVPGNDVYNKSEVVINTTVEKLNVKVVVDEVIGIVGDNITFTAHVTDEYGNPVTGGNLVFKLNGKSLRMDGRFDTNASPMKLNVKNGIVTFTMNVDVSLCNGINLTASYSGSSKYNGAKANVADVSIRKRKAQVNVTASPAYVKQGQDIVFTIKVTDVTSGSSNSLVDSNKAFVILKLNGKTLKDSNGKTLKVKLVNGVATYTYHIPLGTSGIIDGHLRDYMLTAVYANPDFDSDSRDTVVYNVQRSATKINLTSATVKDDKLSIKANILDEYNNNVIGTNKVNIKINGKTFKVDGNSSTMTVKNGVININDINLNGITVKTLTIITGAREAYYDSSLTTKNVKTL